MSDNESSPKKRKLSDDTIETKEELKEEKKETCELKENEKGEKFVDVRVFNVWHCS